MNWLVLAIVALAAAFTIRRFLRPLVAGRQGESPCSCCSSCKGCISSTASKGTGDRGDSSASS